VSWRNAKLSLKITEADGRESTVQVDSNAVVDKKLRRFYAMWCLREAYVKMTGEALLAPWLKDLEISDAQAPDAASEIQDATTLGRGEVVKRLQNLLQGKKGHGREHGALGIGPAYMVAGSVKVPKDYLI